MKTIEKKSNILKAIIVILVLSALFIGIGNYWVVNTEYHYANEKIPKSFEGYRICVISDFHNGINGKTVIKAVEEKIPDIICITGDLISMRTDNYKHSVSLIEELVKIAPVYLVNGNQEYYHATYFGKDKPVLPQILEEYNIEYLNDKGISLEKNGEIINLIGSDDSYYEDDTEGKDIFLKDVEPFLEKMDKKMDKDCFSVLLIHRPQYFDAYSKYGYDLILSGHLHGGVIGIPGIKDKILMSKVGTDEFCKGVYKKGNSTLIVSGGVGTTHLVPRILNLPEVVTVTLHSK